MWLRILGLTTTSIIIVGYFSPCVGYRRFSAVRIHNLPDFSYYFSVMDTIFSYDENKYRREFKRWSEDEKKRACLRALCDSASFSIVRHEAVVDIDIFELSLHDFDKDIMFSKIHAEFQSVKDETKTRRRSVHIKAGDYTTERAPVHFCVSMKDNTGTEVEFAITNGLHPGVLYLLSRQSKDSIFEVIAIVEPIPSLDTRAFTRKYLETIYSSKSNILVSSDENNSTEEESEVFKANENEELLSSISFEDGSQMIKVCELDDFNRYRLCVTAYTAWAQFRNVVYKEIDYIIPPGSDCLQRVKILSLQEELPIADLLPCRIRNDISPQIFVTNDRYDSLSAFILEGVYKRDISDHSEEQPDDDELLGYKFVMRLNNALPFKNHSDEE